MRRVAHDVRTVLPVLFLALASCTPAPESAVAGWRCEGTFDEFAYSDVVSRRGEVQPGLGDPWVVETTIPSSTTEAMGSVAAIRKSKGQIEIWVKVKYGGLPLPAIRHDYWVYSVEQHSWTQYPGAVHPNVLVGDILTTPDGRVFATSEPSDIFGTTNPPLLSELNEATREFEYIEETLSLPSKFASATTGSILALVTLDATGVIWVAEPGDGVYSYDPVARSLERRIDLPAVGVYDFAMSPDGTGFVLLSGELGDFTFGHRSLLELDFATGAQTFVPDPDAAWPRASSILVTREGVLWYSVVGSYAPDRGWTLAHPDPEGHFAKTSGQLNDMIAPPRIDFESSDGRLWLIHGLKGAAWYQPDQATGCWFSRFPTSVLEDGVGTLWAVNGLRLYRLDIASQSTPER